MAWRGGEDVATGRAGEDVGDRQLGVWSGEHVAKGSRVEDWIEQAWQEMEKEEAIDWSAMAPCLLGLGGGERAREPLAVDPFRDESGNLNC